MTIDTKFDIGDKVFFFKNNSVWDAKITRISSNFSGDPYPPRIYYDVRTLSMGNYIDGTYSQDELHATKELLLASLS